MEYNDFVESKKYLRKNLAHLFEMDISGNVIKVVKIQVLQPYNTYNECLIQNKTYEYTIIFTCKVVSGPREGFEQDVSFTIPKMSNKGFIISNPNGVVKWRTSINLGLLSRLIRSYGQDIESFFFTIKPYVREEGGIKLPPSIFIPAIENTYNLKSYMLYYGVPKKDIDELIEGPYSKRKIKYEEVSVPEKYLARFKNKYYQLTKRNLESDSFNGKDAYYLIKAFFEDRDDFVSFSPFDVIFMNQYSSIMKELNTNSSIWEIQQQFRWSFSQHGEFNGEFLSRKIRKIFNFQSSSYNSVQTTSDSNAGAFLSQTKKIYFIRYKKKIDGYAKEKIKFTNNFLGLVCPFETPESVANVNIKNALARNVEIIDGTPFITVLDKDLNKVQLEYIDYYKSKILSNSNFDYDNNKVAPNKGKIKYLFEGKFVEEDYTSMDQFTYIEESETSLVGYNAALIPFLSHNDSVRLSMATNMLNQAIPVTGGRMPIVYTGQESEVYEQSDMNFRSTVSGEVIGVYKEFVKIKTPEGNISIQSAPPSMMSIAHTTNIFEPCVKVGDKVKEGDIIIASNSFKDKELALTVPVIVAPMMFEGYGDDDDILVNSDVAKSLTHIQEKIVDIEIPKAFNCIFDKKTFMNYISEVTNEKILKNLDRLNKFGLPEVGQVYKRGDIIAIYLQESDAENNPQAELRSLVLKTKSYDPYIIQLPAGISEGTVTSVDLVVRPGITELNEVRDYYDDLFDKENRELIQFLDNEKIIKKERPILSSKSEFRCVARIKFRSSLVAKEGDKICNRYAGKGVIGKVVPVDEMPRIGGPDGLPVQVIIGPNSIPNRKNLGVDYEGTLGLLSYKMFHDNEKSIKEKNFDRVRDGLNRLFVTDKFSNYTDEELIQFHSKYQDYYNVKAGPFNKSYNKEVFNKLFDFFGDSYDGTYKIWLPKKKKFVRKKIKLLFSSFLRLHFLVDDKLRATGKLYTGDPVYRIGKRREGGQKIGEQEVAIYQAKGRIDLLEEMYGKTITELVKPKLEAELLLQGMMIQSDELK